MAPKSLSSGTSNGETLPSLEEVVKSLNENKDSDSETWRKVCLQAVEYATMDVARSDEDGEGTGDKTRIHEAASLLLQVINHANGNVDGNESSVVTNRDADMMELVDVIWLAGSMLDDPIDESNDTKKDDKEYSPRRRYEKLCDLIQILASPTSTETKNSMEIQSIPLKLFLTNLEPKLLQDSNILRGRPAEFFLKKMRKLNTDMYYRQKKVNLMQEETEGYAKFIRFLVNVGAEDVHVEREGGVAGTVATENVDHDQAQIIQETKLRTLELIGTFDLDPNRCLDLTLDALEAQIQQVLNASPEPTVLKSTKKRDAGTSDINSSRILLEKLCHAPLHARTVFILLHLIQMSPVENVTHLIGFKFSSYLSRSRTTDGIDQNGDTPMSLYVVTGILASHGLLSLGSLQPHLPPLSRISSQYDQWVTDNKTKIKKMGVVSLNASKKKADGQKNSDGNNPEDIPSSEEEQQVIKLVHVMMQMGLNWNLVMGILQSNEDTGKKNGASSNKLGTSMLVKCCCLFPPLASKLSEILHDIIQDLYEYKVGNANVGSAMFVNNVDEDDTPEFLSGDFSILPMPKMKSEHPHLQQHCVLEVFGTTTNIMELCQKLMTKDSGILEPIIMSGCITSNPILYTKLCRLAHALLLEEINNQKSSSMKNDNSKSDETELFSILKEPVVEFLERFLVPSLSLFPFNPAMASELWAVLSLLPYQIRYSLYASWRQHGLEKAAVRSMIQPPKPLANIESEVTTGMSTKYLLKRMSKDNIRDMGRQVSKVSHNNPLVVFTLMLNQIESYDNLILMMVETFKFMGLLSLDVMGYCLLVSLGGEGEGRNKLKDDGVNPAQWLASLETFTGAFYKRFPDVELRGLLAYFTRRLHGGQILELGVLQSLIKMAGGYGFVDSGSSASLSGVQLDGRCGSLALRRETSDFGIVERVNVQSSTRLRSSLQENACGVTLLILLSQLRQKIVLDETKDSPKQIKLIGNLYDKSHRTLYTMLAFLTDGSEDSFVASEASSIEAPKKGAIFKYATSIPTLSELTSNFGVATADAWALCRPLVRASLFAEEDSLQNKNESTSTPSIPLHLQPFHPTFNDTMQSKYRDMLPAYAWKHITPLIFHRFYSYGIYDVTYPQKRYESEISRLRKEIDRLLMLQKGGRDAFGMQASLAAAAAAAGGTQRDIREATVFTREHANDLERYRHSVERLKADMDQQEKHFNHVKKALESEKKDFLSNLEGEDGLVQTASTFVTTCIYPRCLLSPEDAMYCAQFITILHRMDTPGFYTLEILDVIMNAVVGALYSTTEEEAGCLGTFLNKLWKMIREWRYEETVYQDQVHGKTGAMYTKKLQMAKSPQEKMEDPSSTLTHIDYIALYNKWHANLGAAFIGCLQSSEYMHTRTALVVLSRMVDYFPTKSTLGEKLLKTLAPLQEDDNPMQDIKAMAQGYSSKIILARDTGTWKEEDSRLTKAREVREKKLQEDRKKKAEKQMEEMKKEEEKMTRKVHDHKRDSQQQHGPSKGGLGPMARFTPPPPVSANSLSRHRDIRDRDRGPRRDDGGARWDRSGPIGPDGGRNKRGRSPETKRGSDGRGNNGGGGRDGKRSRREPSPPSRPRRSGRR